MRDRPPLDLCICLSVLLISCSSAPLQSQPDRSGRSVVSIAHRGGVVPDYPENTMRAFREAISAGSEVIEIDLRSTKDQKIVILHDAALDRTTDGSGALINYNLADLRQFDAGMGERIPTYKDVLEQVSNSSAQLLLDLKVTSLPELTRIVRLTEEHGQVLNVIAAIRSMEELRTIQSLNPNIRTLAFIPAIEDIEPYSRAGVDIIRLWPEWIIENPKLVDHVHTFGNAVWTTAMQADEEELKVLIGHGVDGVFTDFPKRVAQLKRDWPKDRP